MPLVASNEILSLALASRFAVGAFNVNNMEQVQAIVEAAQEERAPAIVEVSPNAIRYAGLDLLAATVRAAAAQAGVPIVLHLDHGQDLGQCLLCLRAGFTSLMVDASKRPLAENVAATRQVAQVAHWVGVSVEAELGDVADIAEGLSPAQLRARMTDPDQAAEFVGQTGVDSLAVALGSVGHMVERGAELDIERLQAIHERIPCTPLVLHGSSGVRHESIREAIRYGICKINVATSLNQAFMRGMREGVARDPDNVDPRKVLALSRAYMKEAVREKIRLFGSAQTIDTGGGPRSLPRRFAGGWLGDRE